MKAQSTFSLKDHLFNESRVAALAARFAGVYPAFPVERFVTTVATALPALELKARIAAICSSLHDCLPHRYPEALAIILDALPEPLDPERTDDDFGDFILAPLSLYVATYGCTREHLEISLDALREITKRFSAEDAVRSFINAFPVETLQFLRACAQDDNYHVRRLASEGSRPLLPWARRLTINHRDALPILDTLFADRTRYVTRSVANHLNDISKLDPDTVVETLSDWHRRGGQTEEELRFLTKHALRTLVKQGHAGALELLGFQARTDVVITNFATTTKRVRVGDAFRFSLTIQARSRQQLLVDYVMTFAGNGHKVSRKVFKLKQVELDAGESVTIEKAHPMRLMTTRRLHAGRHSITLQINGQPGDTLAFDLIPADASASSSA